MPLLQRLLSPIVEVRKEETAGVALMFSYSFLAMTGYNVLKPVTRSKFISTLGADNLPYVLLVAGLIIGVLMTGYAWLIARLPATVGAVDHAARDGRAARSGSGSCFRIPPRGRRWRSICLGRSWACCSSASSGRLRTSSTTRGRPSGSSASSAAARRSAALPDREILIRFTDRIGTNSMLLISGTLLVDLLRASSGSIFQRSRGAAVAGRRSPPARNRKALVSGRRCICCGRRRICRSLPW